MREFVRDTLVFVGLGTVGLLILFVIIGIKDGISDKILDLKWEHKYKHRFDKPPTAMCYCKDCMYYNLDKGYCTDGHANKQFLLADSYFCAFASPRKHDPEKEKKE